MNPDQKANIDAMVVALSKSMFSAWSYLHVLRGLHEGGRDNPLVLARFGWLFEQVWRAVFDGFFAKVGTVLDSTKSTYSLPNLVTLVRRYGDPELKQLLPEVEACLSEKNGPLAKIKNWRHAAVAHRSLESQDESFHADNKMNVAELESALVQLEEALNHLSLNVLGIHNDTRNGSKGLIVQGRSMFASLALGIAGAPKNLSGE